MYQSLRQFLCVISMLVSFCNAFQSCRTRNVCRGTKCASSPKCLPLMRRNPPLRFRWNDRMHDVHLGRDSGLQMAGFFDDIGKFFGQGDNNENDDINPKRDEDKEEEEESYAGSSQIFEIPVESVKIGGLRLYLSLHLMGQQNTPEEKCWKMDQTGKTGIDLYHRDQTGILMIQLSETSISFDRLGSAPSMQYLMHETIILEGILDTLDEIMADQSIPESDRLLKLKTPGDALQEARDMLSFA